MQIIANKKDISSIGLSIDGSVVGITPGNKGYSKIPYNCLIKSIDIISDIVGSISFDILTGEIFTELTSICGNDKPTLVADQIYTKSDFNGWNLGIPDGSYISFVVNSASLIGRVILIIKIEKI